MVYPTMGCNRFGHVVVDLVVVVVVDVETMHKTVMFYSLGMSGIVVRFGRSWDIKTVVSSPAELFSTFIDCICSTP